MTAGWGRGRESIPPKNPTILPTPGHEQMSLIHEQILSSLPWKVLMEIQVEGPTLGLKHKGDLVSEPRRGIGWKALLLGQVRQVPGEQAGLLSRRGLTLLGPGLSLVHAPYFKETWATICMLHVPQMFSHFTDLSFIFLKHFLRVFYKPDIPCSKARGS